MLGKTKMGKSKVDELTKKIESVMAVNEKYGGIDGLTGRQEVVDDSLNLSLFHSWCGFKLVRSVI
jgi:hypothetical protein